MFVHALIVVNPAAEAQAPAEPAGGLQAVVPPGQEQLLADMLGKGEPLAGCSFAGGDANGGTIRATYTCPSGEVVLEIVHPDGAAGGATLTDRFAIVPKSGSPPDGLITGLASRIRARESAFEWTWVGTRPESGPTETSIIVVIGLLAVAAFVWLLRSRRSGRRSVTS